MATFATTPRAVGLQQQPRSRPRSLSRHRTSGVGADSGRSTARSRSRGRVAAAVAAAWSASSPNSNVGSIVWGAAASSSSQQQHHLWLTDLFRALTAQLARARLPSTAAAALLSARCLSWDRVRGLSSVWHDIVEDMAAQELFTFETEGEPTSVRTVLQWLLDQPLQTTLNLLLDAALAVQKKHMEDEAIRTSAALSSTSASIAAAASAAAAVSSAACFAAPLAHRHSWLLLSSLFETLPRSSRSVGSASTPPPRVRLDVLLAHMKDWLGVEARHAPLELLDLAEKTRGGELSVNDLYLWWSLFGAFALRARAHHRGSGSAGLFLYLYSFQHRLLTEMGGNSSIGSSSSGSYISPMSPLSATNSSSSFSPASTGHFGITLSPFAPTSASSSSSSAASTSASAAAAAALASLSATCPPASSPSSPSSGPLGCVSVQVFMKVFAHFHPTQLGWQRSAEAGFRKRLKETLPSHLSSASTAAAASASVAASSSVATPASSASPSPRAEVSSGGSEQRKGLCWPEILDLLLSRRKELPEVFRRAVTFVALPAAGTPGSGLLADGVPSHSASGEDLPGPGAGITMSKALQDEQQGWLRRFDEDERAYARVLLTAAAHAHERRLPPFMRAHTPSLEKQMQREAAARALASNSGDGDSGGGAVDPAHQLAWASFLGEDSSLDFEALLARLIEGATTKSSRRSGSGRAGSASDVQEKEEAAQSDDDADDNPPLSEPLSPARMLRVLHTLRYVSHFFTSDPSSTATATSAPYSPAQAPAAELASVSLRDFTGDLLAAIARRDRARLTKALLAGNGTAADQSSLARARREWEEQRARSLEEEMVRATVPSEHVAVVVSDCCPPTTLDSTVATTSAAASSTDTNTIAARSGRSRSRRPSRSGRSGAVSPGRLSIAFTTTSADVVDFLQQDVRGGAGSRLEKSLAAVSNVAGGTGSGARTPSGRRRSLSALALNTVISSTRGSSAASLSPMAPLTPRSPSARVLAQAAEAEAASLVALGQRPLALSVSSSASASPANTSVSAKLAATQQRSPALPAFDATLRTPPPQSKAGGAGSNATRPSQLLVSLDPELDDADELDPVDPPTSPQADSPRATVLRTPMAAPPPLLMISVTSSSPSGSSSAAASPSAASATTLIISPPTGAVAAAPTRAAAVLAASLPPRPSSDAPPPPGSVANIPSEYVDGGVEGERAPPPIRRSRTPGRGTDSHPSSMFAGGGASSPRRSFSVSMSLTSSSMADGGTDEMGATPRRVPQPSSFFAGPTERKTPRTPTTAASPAASARSRSRGRTSTHGVSASMGQLSMSSPLPLSSPSSSIASPSATPMNHSSTLSAAQAQADLDLARRAALARSKGAWVPKEGSRLLEPGRLQRMGPSSPAAGTGSNLGPGAYDMPSSTLSPRGGAVLKNSGHSSTNFGSSSVVLFRGDLASSTCLSPDALRVPGPGSYFPQNGLFPAPRPLPGRKDFTESQPPLPLQAKVPPVALVMHDGDEEDAASASEEHKEAELSESTAGSPHALFTPPRKRAATSSSTSSTTTNATGVQPSPSSAHKRNGSSPAFASNRGVQAKSASSSRKKLNHRA